MRTRPLFWALVTLPFVLLACTGGEEPATSKIFRGPVWEGPESYRYQLVQRTHLYGYCELRTTPEIEPGRTLLERLCWDDSGFRDDGRVLVDSQTLQPIETERRNYDPERDRTAVRTAHYGEGSVLLAIDLGDEERSVTRDLPQPDERSPDPGWYDDESMFWLLRGIPLEEGWTGAYHNVSVGTAQVSVAEVRVIGRTTVEVPAGTFDAWEIEVRSSITNRVWINSEAPHQVVRAEIERITYELLPPEG